MYMYMFKVIKYQLSYICTVKVYQNIDMEAIRYVMCTVAQRNNALHDFVYEDTLE